MVELKKSERFLRLLESAAKIPELQQGGRRLVCKLRLVMTEYLAEFLDFPERFAISHDLYQCYSTEHPKYAVQDLYSHFAFAIMEKSRACFDTLLGRLPLAKLAYNDHLKPWIDSALCARQSDFVAAIIGKLESLESPELGMALRETFLLAAWYANATILREIFPRLEGYTLDSTLLYRLLDGTLRDQDFSYPPSGFSGDILKSCRFLLECGIASDIDNPNPDWGCTLLQHLLKVGARYSTGSSVLPDLLAIFLECGADVNKATDIYPLTPLEIILLHSPSHFSIISTVLAVAEKLIDRGAEITDTCIFMLMRIREQAWEYERARPARWVDEESSLSPDLTIAFDRIFGGCLEEKYTSMSKKFMETIRRGDEEALISYLQPITMHGQTPEADGRSKFPACGYILDWPDGLPIKQAIEAPNIDNIKIIEILFSYGAFMNTWDESTQPLSIAIKLGKKNIIQYLVQVGCVTSMGPEEVGTYVGQKLMDCLQNCDVISKTEPTPKMLGIYYSCYPGGASNNYCVNGQSVKRKREDWIYWWRDLDLYDDEAPEYW
ncbi:hypothetical protein ABW19_dt0208773 [Dactylella cylindrospora]|nr:hypothetical protein ABW19_dt0208773 [Dactylella cylindrospora]